MFVFSKTSNAYSFFSHLIKPCKSRLSDNHDQSERERKEKRFLHSFEQKPLVRFMLCLEKGPDQILSYLLL